MVTGPHPDSNYVRPDGLVAPHEDSPMCPSTVHLMNRGNAGAGEDLPGLEDVQWFMNFLAEEPPYEAIGKVIHAGADLESGIFSLCTHYGLTHAKAWRKDVAERVKWLKNNTPLDSSILDRVAPAVEKRNLLAHGTWIRFKDKRGFLKYEKEDPGNLRGQLVDADVLEDWRSDLQDLADYMTSQYLQAGGPGTP